MHPTPLRIAHLTDTHILADPGGRLRGVDTFAAAEAVLAGMERDRWRPDLVVVTGDLSDDGSAASYERLRGLLTRLGVPVYCVPGNHDARAVMETHLRGGNIHLERSVVRAPWGIVFLDSQVPGHDHGRLGAAELAALDRALAEMPEHFVLVALHHGPFPVCPQPACRLENAQEFLAALARHARVRGVIAGHTHCTIDAIIEQLGSVRALVTPSPCVNLRHPDASQAPDPRPFWDVHRIDPDRAGFRRLELYADGRMATRVIGQGDDN